MNITRDQAICMFFYVEHSEENVKKYKKKIEDFEEVGICYNADERKPILAHKLSTLGDHFGILSNSCIQSRQCWK
jgi:hypothetical protein